MNMRHFIYCQQTQNLRLDLVESFVDLQGSQFNQVTVRSIYRQ